MLMVYIYPYRSFFAISICVYQIICHMIYQHLFFIIWCRPLLYMSASSINHKSPPWFEQGNYSDQTRSFFLRFDLKFQTLYTRYTGNTPQCFHQSNTRYHGTYHVEFSLRAVLYSPWSNVCQGHLQTQRTQKKKTNRIHLHAFFIRMGRREKNGRHFSGSNGKVGAPCQIPSNR